MQFLVDKSCKGPLFLAILSVRSGLIIVEWRGLTDEKEVCIQKRQSEEVRKRWWPGWNRDVKWMCSTFAKSFFPVWSGKCFYVLRWIRKCSNNLIWYQLRWYKENWPPQIDPKFPDVFRRSESNEKLTLETWVFECLTVSIKRIINSVAKKKSTNWAILPSGSWSSRAIVAKPEKLHRWL